jgi:hypothetical protein
MKHLLLAAVLTASLALAVAGPAAADRPIAAFSDTETFVDVDPCSGLSHEVTIDVTFFVHDHAGVTVARGVRTLTTSSGYFGRGTSSFVENGNVELFRFSDLLSDDSGNRIRAQGVFVLDPKSGSVRVESFSLTCLGS